MSLYLKYLRDGPISYQYARKTDASQLYRDNVHDVDHIGMSINEVFLNNLIEIAIKYEIRTIQEIDSKVLIDNIHSIIKELETTLQKKFYADIETKSEEDFSLIILEKYTRILDRNLKSEYLRNLKKLGNITEEINDIGRVLSKFTKEAFVKIFKAGLKIIPVFDTTKDTTPHKKLIDFHIIILTVYILSFISCRYIKSVYSRDRNAFIKEFIETQDRTDDGLRWRERLERLRKVVGLGRDTATVENDEVSYILFLIASALDNDNLLSTDTYNIDNIIDNISQEINGVKVYPKQQTSRKVIDRLISAFGNNYTLSDKKIIKNSKADTRKYTIEPLNLKYLFEIGKNKKHFYQTKKTYTQFEYNTIKTLYNNIINRPGNIINIGEILQELDSTTLGDNDTHLRKLITDTKINIPKYEYDKNKLTFTKESTYNYESQLEPRLKFLDYTEKIVQRNVTTILFNEKRFNLIDKKNIQPLNYTEYEKRKRSLEEKLPEIIKKFADTSLYDDFMDLAATDKSQIEMNLYVSRVSEELKAVLSDHKKEANAYDGVTIVNYKKESNILIVLNRAPYTYDDNTRISTMIRYDEVTHTGFLDTSVHKIVKRNDETYTEYLKDEVLSHFKDGKPYNFITQGGSGSGKSYTISKILKLIIGDGNATIQQKIKVAQDLLSCFINARTPNNDDSSRCLTSIKHTNNRIQFIVEGLECRRILTDYVWSNDKFIIKDGTSEWHNSGKGNQPFHAFLSKINPDHSYRIGEYEKAKLSVIGGKNSAGTSVEVEYGKNQDEIQKCIDKLHQLSLIGSLYNDIYVCLLKNTSGQTGGEIVTEGLGMGNNYLKIKTDVLKDVFKAFIVQDKGVGITDFNVKKKTDTNDWFKTFVDGTNDHRRKADFNKFFNVFYDLDNYNVTDNEYRLDSRYDPKFFEKFDINFFKLNPTAKFEIDNIITKVEGIISTDLKQFFNIDTLKQHIKTELNTEFSNYNHTKIIRGKNTDDTLTKIKVTNNIQTINSEIQNINLITDIIYKLASIINNPLNGYYDIVKKKVAEIKDTIDTKVKSVIDAYKIALTNYIRDVNNELAKILKKKTTNINEAFFNSELLKNDILTTYEGIFDYIDGSGTEIGAETGVRNIILNYQQNLKIANADKRAIINKILNEKKSPEPSLILQRVILAMDLYNIEVSNLCELLTIDTSTSLTSIPPFDMIDIYGFEKKMTDSTDKDTVIDTTSFVINHVNDRAMAAFLNALLNGLNISLKNATSDYDKANYEVCINVCKYAIKFIDTIVNNAFGYTVNHYTKADLDCINKIFEKYKETFNTENKGTQLNTAITEYTSNQIPKSVNNYIKSIHSTYELVSYIIDVYSPKGMYNIKDSIKNKTTISIDDIEQYLTDSKNPPGNQRPDTKTRVTVKECNISYNADTNFSLKTITNIIKMFKVRNNLRDYTFVKCIKATSRVKQDEIKTTFKYEEKSETPDTKSNPVKYADKIIQDQLKNLGISLILAIEPKKQFTLFKKSKKSSDDNSEKNVNMLVRFIETAYYPVNQNTVFTINKEFTNEIKGSNAPFIESDDYIEHKITGVQYYKTKYYEVKDGFTIKKFLENIFRLYDIIPKQTLEF